MKNHGNRKMTGWFRAVALLATTTLPQVALAQLEVFMEFMGVPGKSGITGDCSTWHEI